VDGGASLVFDGFMNTIDCTTETPGEFRQRIQIRTHELHADVLPTIGGKDSAPGPHDFFDAALAACKALTATWYAKKNGIALERVEAHVERDDHEERAGRYKLSVRLAFHGPMTDKDRARLYDAVSRCPLHKLMTTSEVTIETAPLEAT
jgi:putative redox protein